MNNFNVVPSQGKFGESISVINQNFQIAQQEMQVLENIASPSRKYATVVATSQTESETDVLPPIGSTDTIYRVGNWDGAQFDETSYTEYAWNGTLYVPLSTNTQIGEVFDISAYHATGGTLATYADLSAALGTNGANIPEGIRKGGMSVKFIQDSAPSSDNKYVQYRLMADEFTTDTTQWAIDDAGVYVENPEFVYVKTDKDGKILWAIKVDGSIYYGAGVPQQIIDYIEEKLAELSLDEYEDIVTFLGNLIEGDTLATLLNGKVDKEEGKGIVVTQYVQDVENPEWMKVETDSEGKILGGRKKDGTVVENVGIEAEVIKTNSLSIKDEIVLGDEATNKLLNAIHPCKGKKISVIGDSISTCFRNYGVYWKVLSVDVGQEIKSYITLWDVYQDSEATIPTNKTIGGVALTREMIGTLQTFTPIAEDVGKELGMPVNYNGRDTIVWSEVLCESVGATLLSSASWSGSRICKGQEQLRYVLSEAWSDYTIGCLKRRDNDGNDIIPDVVIIYKGTNDMTHEPYTRLNDIDLMNGVPDTDYINSQYEFKAGYYLTIKKIRETYPKAIIVCCTLNNFKRINYSHFPVNNGINTLPDYNNAIREIANTMGCDLIEFDKDGITYENMYSEGYITDSATIPTHPNNKGHKVMAERAIADLRNISFN